MKKSIVILLNSLKNHGGAERVAVSYANWVSKNTDDNVYILKLDNIKSAYQIDKKVNVIELNIPLSKNKIIAFIQRTLYCKRKLKEIDADIIFTLFYQTELYALLSKPKGCKLIGSERNNINYRGNISKFLCRFLSKKCDGFIFQTKGAQKLYPKNVRKNSTVIANAISNNLVYELKSAEKEDIVSATGRLTYQKGFDTLIKSFAIVIKDHPNYKLHIYGEGNDREKMLQLIKKMHLEESVLLLGNVDNHIFEIAKSKIFVLSSRFEGMPNALIEAMASGVACVSTDCDFGPRELIEDGKNGILVEVDNINDLASKINLLIEDEDLRKRIENNSLEIRKILDPGKIYKSYYDYFNKIINKEKLNIRKKIIKSLMNRGYLNFLSDKCFLKLKYKLEFDRKINLNNPQTFNEKLQWIKLYDRKDLYTTMVDKYEVKKYVANIIGDEYIIPTVGIYNKFNDINFEELPERFVIKCTHDSGGIAICSDKNSINLDDIKEKIENSLKTNYYYHSREWPYKNVQPRIIIEKYMGENLNDYKLMCFNGKVKYCLACTERYSQSGLKVTFFDRDWNKMPFGRPHKLSDEKIKKPNNYDQMISLAEKLSKDIPFLRVDFYEINNKVFFGELTFFPGSGFEKFVPGEWDYKLGKLIDLNIKKK